MIKKKYVKKAFIGKGGFGEIYKVLDNETNNFYALKFIAMNKENKDDIKKIETEITVMKEMKNIDNDYIIKLKEYFYDEEAFGYCIVMELCDGSLRDILNNYKLEGLPLNIIKKIFLQLNEALKTIINKGFIHRDLKPENILIKYTDSNKTNFNIKLTDFGLSTDEVTSSIKYHPNAGDKIYKAPEVEKFEYNKKCDLWSLGIILYELYTNKYIFGSKNSEETQINRYKGKIVKETDNEMINKLIRKLIQVDIDKRITWEEYFKDDFFQIEEENKKDKNELTDINSNNNNNINRIRKK